MSIMFGVYKTFSSTLLQTRIMSTVTSTYYKDFNDIPGPKSLPLFGTRHLYLPYIGKYSFEQLHKNGVAKFQKYGPIVRENIKPGVTLVWIFTPEDYAILYQNEGLRPCRRSHLALQKYRLDRPEMYNNGGLLPSNGAEWWKCRSSFQQYLKVQPIKVYVRRTNSIFNEFSKKRIDRIRNFQDFCPELSRLFLELTFYIAFNERLQKFDDNEWNVESESSQLIKAIGDINRKTLSTDFGPQLWRWFNTPAYIKITKANQTIEKMALKMIQKKLADTETTGSNCLLRGYLSSGETDIKDVLGMTVDTLLGGVDTLTFSLCFGLHRVATHPEVQQKLFNEVRGLLPEKEDDVSDTVLERSVYMKAAIKEIQRMDPLSVGIGRILTQPCVFSGYRVPEGAIVVTQNQVTCRLPQYFSQPDSFIPERWLKGSAQYERISPFSSLPFSHGPRSCIARRLAMQSLQIILSKIVRNYEITWTGGELGSRFELINKPDRPISLKFTPRQI